MYMKYPLSDSLNREPFVCQGSPVPKDIESMDVSGLARTSCAMHRLGFGSKTER